MEDIAGEVAVSRSEGEEDAAQGLELGEVEVVRDEAREDFRFSPHCAAMMMMMMIAISLHRKLLGEFEACEFSAWLATR